MLVSRLWIRLRSPQVCYPTSLTTISELRGAKQNNVIGALE